jgi:hypothetical protein
VVVVGAAVIATAGEDFLAALCWRTTLSSLRVME